MNKYFRKATAGDEVFGLVFGHGVISSVWDTDSYYTFEVTYDNGSSVPYTLEGYPAWTNGEFRTVFYKSEVDMLDLDTSEVGESILKPKAIIKLRLKSKLEIKCPSGVWQDIHECPEYIAEEFLLAKKFEMFRKKVKDV